MAPQAEPKTNRGLLAVIIIVAALALGFVISSVALKSPPVEDSAPLEAQLDGKAKDGGAGDSLESRLGQ